MSRPGVSIHSLVRPRVAAFALIGVALAGCSNSGRFDTPYPTASNARAYPQGEVTGSIAPRRAPVHQVVSQPLPAPSRPATVAAPSGGYASGAQGLGAYRPNTYASSDVTGSIHTPQPQPAGHWTWDGGSPVTVGYGESVAMIARKYGVPEQALLETNGINDPSQVRAGQRLVIPRYVASAAPEPQMPPPQVAAPSYLPRVAAPSGAENVHVVAPGESLIGIARRYHVSLAVLARHNNLQPYTKVNIGDRIAIPGAGRTAARQAPPPVQRVVEAPQPQQPMPQLAQPRTVPTERVAAAPVQVRVATQEKPTTETAASTAEPAGSGMPSFRWPVHGRVIAGFGPKPNGSSNDGINLAVPEGTPIKAADDGVVAYAGNELKGYGNLVLIRHANGFVSAYANASELLVKRGDSIKRGQVVANAGQTGNVTSPQLHFEIRKGSTPVDPTKYLSGN